MNHFCTCTDQKCACHPVNHDKGCDQCIQKNLKQGEIPACFYRQVGGDTSTLTQYTMESFVRFYLKTKGISAETEN